MDLDAVEDIERHVSFAAGTSAAAADAVQANASMAAHRRVTITFQDLTYTIQQKKPITLRERLFQCKRPEHVEKDLLKNVTGAIRPGKLTALMGPSGAGKSTLLDVIAGRKSAGTITGQLLFNGRERAHNFKRQCGYVEQQDILLGTLTVRELLVFTAHLRMPHTTTEAEREARAQTVIDQLELTGCADVIVGTRLQRGVSGGQAKRVNIGMELVTEPAILFLDEPTSGLDSTTALDVMRVVRAICDRGTTVICTIHQPSTDIYNLFDRLLLLVRGEVVFLGNSDAAVDYFVQAGYTYPPNMNPADFIIGVTSESHSEYKLLTGPTVTEGHFARLYRESALSQLRLQSTKTALSESKIVLSQELPLFVNTPWYNFRVLYSRNVKKMLRDPSFFKTRLVMPILIAIVFLLVYLHSPYDIQGLRSRQALLFLTIIFMTVGSSQMIGPLVEDRMFFNRERASASYQVSAYYFSMILFEMPYMLLKGLLWSIVLYWGVGFNEDPPAFFIFAFVTMVLADLGGALAQFFAAAFAKTDTATAAMTTIPLVFLIFSGFFIPFPSIPKPWLFAYYTSYANYAMAAYLINEVTNNPNTYFTQSTLCIGNSYACPSDTSSCQTVASVLTPDAFLQSLGMPITGFFANRFANILMLCILWLLFRASAYFALRYIRHSTH